MDAVATRRRRGRLEQAPRLRLRAMGAGKRRSCANISFGLPGLRDRLHEHPGPCSPFQPSLLHDRPSISPSIRHLKVCRRADVRFPITRSRSTGLNVFYREAGPADAPTVLAAARVSVVIADVGALAAASRRQISSHRAGLSRVRQFHSAPAPSHFDYTFDNIARVMSEFTARARIASYVLFMQDYGGPVGFSHGALRTPSASAPSSSRMRCRTNRA